MIQRGGEVVIRMLANVQQATIKPLIQATISPGTCIYTDEYDIYNRFDQWGYKHQSVCHGCGEYARDDDGDGFHEVHVNTMEGFWSLLRSWLRPHRGISQDNLPLYVGFFEFVHNVRRRGKALWGTLLELLLAQLPGTHIEPKFFVDKVSETIVIRPSRERRPQPAMRTTASQESPVIRVSWLFLLFGWVPPGRFCPEQREGVTTEASRAVKQAAGMS